MAFLRRRLEVERLLTHKGKIGQVLLDVPTDQVFKKLVGAGDRAAVFFVRDVVAASLNIADATGDEPFD